ncbi:MAG: type II toxin-antitoxin system RelE/ParE family toxin [Gemmatimonadota bacterium]
MSIGDRPLIWLHGEVRTPPLSPDARVEAGVLLRRVQRGEVIGLPHGRSMPGVGKRCFEFRIQDVDQTWRILYRLDTEAVVILEVFSKKTQHTPKYVIDACKARLKAYDKVTGE